MRAGSRPRLFGGSLLLDPPHRPDRTFVEQHQRQSQRQLADDVGRGENCRNDESADNKVATFLLELLRSDDADPSQEGENHGQLKRSTESENEPHHKIEVLTDLGKERNLRLSLAAQ